MQLTTHLHFDLLDAASDRSHVIVILIPFAAPDKKEKKKRERERERARERMRN